MSGNVYLQAYNINDKRLIFSIYRLYYKKISFMGVFRMRLSANALIIILIFFLSSSFSLAKQANSSGIEISQLIKMYMLPEKESYNVLPWETGSMPSSQIDWQHAGSKECPPHILNKFRTYFCRHGKVIITRNGKPTHTVLGRVVEPGVWDITLAGARMGVFHVIIESSDISHDLGSDTLTVTGKSRSGVRFKEIKACGGYAGGAAEFKISAPGRKNAFANVSWSCGSAGCTPGITITPDVGDGNTGDCKFY
ncbi:hypothetical protein [Elstera sp.]|uniref:hypothetical protein n=1 Tax=Elstera sp. TaxID=1916664 RepID=UPI0037BF73C7